MLLPCRWVPVYADAEQRLAVMSIGFLLKNRDDSVVWRGPKKNGKDLCYYYFMDFFDIIIVIY